VEIRQGHKKTSGFPKATEGFWAFPDPLLLRKSVPPHAWRRPTKEKATSSGFRLQTWPHLPTDYSAVVSGFVAGYSGATASVFHGLPYAFPILLMSKNFKTYL